MDHTKAQNVQSEHQHGGSLVRKQITTVRITSLALTASIKIEYWYSRE